MRMTEVAQTSTVTEEQKPALVFAGAWKSVGISTKEASRGPPWTSPKRKPAPRNDGV